MGGVSNYLREDIEDHDPLHHEIHNDGHDQVNWLTQQVSPGGRLSVAELEPLHDAAEEVTGRLSAIALAASFARGLSVTDPAFGADPTGTTSSMSALNAVVAALPSAGGLIYFPPGTYLANNWRIAKSNVTIWMARGAVLKKNANGPVILWGTGGQTKIDFLDLQIDGQGATYTGGGVKIDGGTFPTSRGGHILDTASNPIEFTGAGFGHSAKVTDMILTPYDCGIGGANENVAAVKLPLDTGQAPNRQFVNIQTNGALLWDDAGSQDTKWSMCTARNVKTTGDPGKLLVSTCRLASIGQDITLRGVQSTFVGNALAGKAILHASSSECTVVGNVVAGDLQNEGSGNAFASNALAGVFIDKGAQAQIAGQGDGTYPQPHSLDPRHLTGPQVLSSGTAVYMRVKSRGWISKVGLHVAVSSGNICVGVYANNGLTGKAARPTTQKATSGSVACPAAGYAEVSLGGSVYVEEGEWLALVSNNNTASFYVAGAGGFTSTICDGLSHHQFGAFPLPAPAGSLSSAAWSFVLTGVA